MDTDKKYLVFIPVLLGGLLTLALFAQTSPSEVKSVMTNATVEAMFRGGVPMPTIISAIKTATKVDFLIDNQAFAQFTKAGASNSESDQILEAMHQRVIHGVSSAPSGGIRIYQTSGQDQVESTPKTQPAVRIPTNGKSRPSVLVSAG